MKKEIGKVGVVEAPEDALRKGAVSVAKSAEFMMHSESKLLS